MTSKRIEVTIDDRKCLGYGLCLGLPEVFDMPAGSNVAVVNRSYFDESMLDEIEAAAKDCPAAAIHFEVVEAEES